MSDSSPYTDARRDSVDDVGGGEPGRGSTTGAPRWVRASAIIALAIVLMVGLMLLLGSGKHGPGRHTSGDAGDPATPTRTMEFLTGRDRVPTFDGTGSGGHTPPAGGHGP